MTINDLIDQHDRKLSSSAHATITIEYTICVLNGILEEKPDFDKGKKIALRIQQLKSTKDEMDR